MSLKSDAKVKKFEKKSPFRRKVTNAKERQLIVERISGRCLSEKYNACANETSLHKAGRYEGKVFMKPLQHVY